MPMTSHMEVTGNTQGKIDGSCDMEGRENTMLVYAFDHKVHIPRDPQSGLPSGKRIHGPLTVVKEIDKSSPKLYQALCTGEQLSNVVQEVSHRSHRGRGTLLLHRSGRRHHRRDEALHAHGLPCGERALPSHGRTQVHLLQDQVDLGSGRDRVRRFMEDSGLT